jgi:hypothetical protein
MSVDKWVHLKNVALEPDDVCQLLNAVELAPGPVAVKGETLRELVLVWLRVAALYEALPVNGGNSTADRELVEALLFGAPVARDTEPNHEAPTPPPGEWQ